MDESADGVIVPYWNVGQWAGSACSGSARGFEPVIRRGSQSPDAPLIGEQRRQFEVSQGLMQMGLWRGRSSFFSSNGGMFADVDEGQSD